MDEAVDWLRKSFRPDAAVDLEVAYRFELDGPHCPDLELRVISGRLEVGLDEPGAPDVVFRLSSDDFYGVLAGRENPDLLFMDDRLVVDGDLSLALQLRKLFGAPA